MDVIPEFRSRPRHEQLALILASCGVLSLLIIEGSATGWAPTVVATVLTGALCMTALVVLPRRFPLVAGVAVAASFTLTVVTLTLTHRPVLTPGLVEQCALLLIVTRGVRLLSPLRAIALAIPTGLTAGLLPLRLAESEWGLATEFLGYGALFGLTLACLLGAYLRLLDSVRAREREADRTAQRLEYARELHDFVAHHITAIVAQSKAVRFTMAAGQTPTPDELDALLGRIEEAGSQAMDSMRGMVSVLRDPAIPAATRPGDDLSGLRELTGPFEGTGTRVELAVDPRLPGRVLPPGMGGTVQRVVREALTNVRKHAAGATRVTVDVRLHEGPMSDEGRTVDAGDGGSDGTAGSAGRTIGGGDGDGGEVRVTVVDDGRARNRPGSGSGTGFGLLGLRERVETMGGTLTAGPSPALDGWEVSARLPLPPSFAPGAADTTDTDTTDTGDRHQGEPARPSGPDTADPGDELRPWTP
ncbi:sensor histidine kinase [Streptomyces clavuligerus]|uniref:sensor histidine kinase n=1 Tax=Streptomyces clavuligerus TaxID=1901 RepID=UPI0018D0EDC8|nr:histidine kinase [Streptomyces clavuligerus]